MKITSACIVFLWIFLLRMPVSAEIYSRIEGIVKDKESKVVLENAEILLYEFDHILKSRRIYRKSSSDNKGNFVIDNIRVRDKSRYSYFLSVRKSGYISIIPEYLIKNVQNIQKIVNVLNIIKGEIRVLEIELEQGGKAKIQLLKRTTEGVFPLANKRVELWRVTKNGEPFSENILHVVNMNSDNNGIVIFDSLSPREEYEIFAFEEGFPIYRKTIIANKDGEIKFEHTFNYTSEKSIWGIVTKNGEPFFDVGVYLRTEEGDFVSEVEECDVDGTYVFREIPAGNYRLKFVYIDENYQIFEKNIQIRVKSNISSVVNQQF